MISRIFLALLLGGALAVPAAAQFRTRGEDRPPEVSANVSSRFLARGEYARLQIVADGREPDVIPAPPAVPGVRIEGGRVGAVGRGFTGRSLQFSYEFIISSYEVGRHVIPPISIVVGGQRVETRPVEFHVFDPDKMEFSEAEIGGRTFPYFAVFQTGKTDPYEGESMPVEIKVYVPLDLARSVQDWGVPEFERDNVTSWRFEPTDNTGRVTLLGRPFQSLVYPSTMAPSKAGPVGIGPATLRLTTTVVDYESGFPNTSFREVYLKIPKLAMDARPLPEGAPKGFENAIGRFEVQATIAKPEISDGESLGVSLTVTGSGNLDTVHAPKLADETGWKVYAPIAIPRGEERRRIEGSTSFHQGLLPLEMKPLVPPFQLVYFDPEEGAYKTASSEAIPIKMTPSTRPPLASQGPPSALPVPLERMTDILATIRPSSLTTSVNSGLPGWFWHAVAAALALVLAGKAVWNRIQPKLHKDPVREAKTSALGAISRIPATDDIAFLKSAGAYIEQWRGGDPDPALREILAERDRVCFRAEKTAGALGKGRREEILRALRKATLLAVLVLAMGAGTRAEAADIPKDAQAAYDAGKYEEAIRLWQSAGGANDLSADVLYNIGNASYRLGSPGHAALYFRRALEKNPTHEEARQNLRFIERKHGAISVTYSDFQYALAKISLGAWKGLLWAGVWFVVIGLLIFPATRPGARLRYAAATLLILAPFLASAGALGWNYYPNDSVFAPASSQAVIIAPGTVLHSDAARTSPEVIDAPQGSLCEVLRISGKWAYISFASRTRGWVPVSSFEKLLPEGPLTVPKIAPPPVDDSNA